MNAETFKTILLVNLVGISLFLTYSLWTYQPDSSVQSNPKYIQDVPAVAKKEATALLYPSRMIVHKENTHKASDAFNTFSPLYRLLEKGELIGLEDRSSSIPKAQFLSFVHGKDKIELTFSVEAPLETFRSLWDLKDKHLDSYSFDRIIIDAAEGHDNDIPLYFVSYKERKVYATALRGISLKELERERDAVLAKATDYFLYKIDETRAIFLPEAASSLQKKLYVTSNLLEEQFKNVLFTDPRYVKKDDTNTEEIFTDGIRLLRISKENRMLRFENSAVTSSQYTTGTTLIQQSIDFINSHGGWSDTYRLDTVNSQRGKTIFRIYEGDYPLFNKNGMAALKQIWGTNELKVYERPLFRLFLEKEEDEKVNLPSGRTILPVIEKNPEANLEKIRDIDIGYELEPQLGVGNDRIIAVRLNPIWYIKYDDRYAKIEWDTAGGKIVGMEQN